MTPQLNLRDSATFDLVGIGVSVWDSVFVVENLPGVGEVVRAVDQIDGIGGGITVAIATAARFGSKARLIDSLGDDVASVNLRQSLESYGCDTSAIRVLEGFSTSKASIWSELSSRERSIVFYPGSSADALCWSKDIESSIESSRVLHINGRHPAVCRQAVKLGKQCGTLVSFDGGAYRYRSEIIPFLLQADIAIVAKQFAQSHYQQRTGNRDGLPADQLVGFLRSDLDSQLIGITDGPRGSWLSAKGGPVVYQKAIGTDQAIDTTGCGDTYHGAFLHAFCRGEPLEKCAGFAAEIAAANARMIGGLAFELPPHDHV